MLKTHIQGKLHIQNEMSLRCSACRSFALNKSTTYVPQSGFVQYARSSGSSFERTIWKRHAPPPLNSILKQQTDQREIKKKTTHEEKQKLAFTHSFCVCKPHLKA